MPTLRAVVLAQSNQAPNWLSEGTPVLTAASPLTDNQLPSQAGYDCTTTVYHMGLHNEGPSQTGCGYPTSLGTIIKDQNILVGGQYGTLVVDYGGGAGFVVPSPSSASVVLDVPSSSSSASYLKIEPYIPSALKQVSYWGVPVQHEYAYSVPNAQVLKDSTGKPVLLYPDTLAYSANKEWMAVVTYGGGIAVYDTTSWKGKVISWDLASSRLSYGTRGTNLAVSDDGKYVAVNADLGTASTPKPSLRVYDTGTCKDQYASSAATSNDCEYRDIWNGTYRGKPSGAPLKNMTNAEYPRRIRFQDSNTLEFDSVHDRTSATTFAVSRYTVSVGSSDPTPYIGLLGMGDSYISGEGAYYYREGTDTANNGCHTSWLSYPYQQGMKYFPSAKSVACSGAVMTDITDDLDSYKGQYSKVKWGSISANSQSTILNQFVPGYANQKRFASKYRPQVTLLSIGGNDIHFSDILKSCILPYPTPSDTCYGSYEQRYQLMQNINDQYASLVDTYRQVATASGGRVYVIGYPQIAKVGSVCASNVHLNDTEVQFSDDVISYLDSVIKRAASEAGVYYVNTENALNGYRLCEAPKNQSAVNGLTAGNDALKIIGKESYHPTAYGHKLLGTAIAKATNNFNAPMPSPGSKWTPSIDLNNPLLKNVPSIGEKIWKLVWDYSTAPDQLTYQAGQISLDLASNGFDKLSEKTVIIHSQSTQLYKGYPDADSLQVTIPSSLEPGFHTVDVYGKDITGKDIDVRKVVYVAASSNDYDSDGIPNTANQCLIVPLSGVDADGDGTDDACDGNIIDPSIIPDGTDIIEHEPPFVEETPAPANQTEATGTTSVAVTSTQSNTSSPTNGTTPAVNNSGYAQAADSNDTAGNVLGAQSFVRGVIPEHAASILKHSSSGVKHPDISPHHARKWLLGILLLLSMSTMLRFRHSRKSDMM